MTGTFQLELLELGPVLPTLPAQELSLLTCPNLRLQQPLFSLPTLPLRWQPHPFGTVQAAGPEALGTFLTFALVSSSSWQLLAGPLSLHPQPSLLRCPIVLTASWSQARTLLVPSSHSGLLRDRHQPRNECGIPPATFGPALGLRYDLNLMPSPRQERGG